MTTTRDSPTIRISVAALGFWGILCGVTYITLGDRVTSRQWEYLMSVPGGKWFWGLIFGICGICSLIGVARRYYWMIVFGTCGIGLVCLFIMAIYFFASAAVDDLFTLGWLPWLLAGTAGIAIGAMNRNDREW